MDEISGPFASLDEEIEVAESILRASSSGSQSRKRNKHSLDEYDFSNDVQLVLHGMGMEKYYNLFANAGVTLDTFLLLDESDLTELGIKNEKDIETIMKNLRIYEAKPKKLLVRENSLHYLQIARNIRNELVLLQNYCSYLELQMRKQRLTDYRINWQESASAYLKAFTEAASLQGKILSQRVFHDCGDNHLIGKVLKLSNLTLSKDLKEKLKNEKPKGRKGRQRVLCVAVILGVLSLAAVIKYFS